MSAAQSKPGADPHIALRIARETVRRFERAEQTDFNRGWLRYWQAQERRARAAIAKLNEVPA